MALAVVGVPNQAAAAPPFLVSASQENRTPTATWSLPTGVESALVEVATSPATASDGYFQTSNVVIFATLTPTQTSWRASRSLTPGTFYLHVGGIDRPCFLAGQCPVREFTQTAAVVIPDYGPCSADHLPLIREFRAPPTLEWNRSGKITASVHYSEGRALD
jgi:hypothetical protein